MTLMLGRLLTAYVVWKVLTQKPRRWEWRKLDEATLNEYTLGAVSVEEYVKAVKAENRRRLSDSFGPSRRRKGFTATRP